MTEIENLAEILELGKEKISLGRKLIQDLSSVERIDGVKKVQRKILQEIKFLSKKVDDGTIKQNHIMCSNLVHFDCLVSILLKCRELKNVDFALALPDRESPLRIDIVCDGGACWIKVIARNSRSISDAVHGRTGYGAKSILDQAEEYVIASHRNPHLFKPPVVYFIFNSEIDDQLVEELETTGISVHQFSDFSGPNSIPISLDSSQIIFEGVEKLNLDITTLLAYVSALTNTHSKSWYWEFAEPILTEQSKWELNSPVKPILDQIFTDKKLICCESAVNSFKEIVSLLGGENEKRRAEELLERIEILPDVKEMPNDFFRLNVGGKIKPRSVQIFAFGLVHQAVTVTSNEGFIRAARMQGIDVPAFVHEARALTEQKETNAQKIST